MSRYLWYYVWKMTDIWNIFSKISELNKENNALTNR